MAATVRALLLQECMCKWRYGLGRRVRRGFTGETAMPEVGESQTFSRRRIRRVGEGRD